MMNNEMENLLEIEHIRWCGCENKEETSRKLAFDYSLLRQVIAKIDAFHSSNIFNFAKHINRQCLGGYV